VTPQQRYLDVLAIVVGAVVTVMEVDTSVVTPATSLAGDLGADSLALVEIVDIVEEAVGAAFAPAFHIDDEDLDQIVTVGDAVDYALARV
jgi:acyl carrier protein